MQLMLWWDPLVDVQLSSSNPIKVVQGQTEILQLLQSFVGWVENSNPDQCLVQGEHGQQLAIGC